ncbi:MAG: hypothetical protein IPK26_30565 [Planctomycetes bacterium]|nr:hypothetical protein [Planctomycetota bacterium]
MALGVATLSRGSLGAIGEVVERPRSAGSCYTGRMSCTRWLWAGTLTAALAAQESRGLAAHLPIAIGLDGGFLGQDDATTWFKRNGFQPPPAAPAPAFNLASVLAAANGSGLDVDDISVGQDQLLIGPDGFISVPQGRWGALTFSVRAGTQGLRGSRLRTEAQAGVVGADVFSWVLPGSILPVELTDAVERASDRSELGLTGAAAEVDALDGLLPLGIDQSDLDGFESAQFQNLLPVPYTIYFTLSSTAASAAPPSWFQGTPRSGATILCVQSSVPGGPFSAPSVWKRFDELGLTQADDIDALAIDRGTGKVVFSLKSRRLDQLMFVDLVLPFGPPVPQPVRKDAATTVSQAIGVDSGAGSTDDVDAVCGLDPQIRSGQVGVANPLIYSMGTPRPRVVFPNSPALQASAARRVAGATSIYDTWITGWPSGAPQPGLVGLIVSLGESVLPGDQFGFGVFVRVPGAPIAGNPIHEGVPIPNTARLTGLRATLRWFAADLGSPVVAEAYPLLIFL